MNEIETQFIKIYGKKTYEKIKNYVIDSDIGIYYDLCTKSGDPNDLFKFGFHYGILEIVAFCYCYLKIEANINDIISGYYSVFESENPISIEQDFDRNVYKGRTAVPTGYQRTKMIAATIDKYTVYRKKCIDYLINIRKYSKYNVSRSNGKVIFSYQINEKHIEPNNLLNVISFTIS